MCRDFQAKNLHNVYSNERLQLAASRQPVELFNRQLLGVDVIEIFSPERVGKQCKQYGFDHGSAMDILSGYDCDKAEDRKRCWEAEIQDERIRVIVSPPCTVFSRLQQLNKFMYNKDREWMGRIEDLLGQAKKYVRFCAAIYEHQRAHGRYLLHEHPWLATSWQMDVMTRLQGYPDVRKVQTHMCQFGMVSRTANVGSALGPILKSTGFLTNCPGIARELARKCPRYHEHVHLVGGRAAGAALYPQGLCRAICRRLAAHLREDKARRVRTATISASSLNNCQGRLLSLRMARQQALGREPVDNIDDNGKLCLNGIQMEANDDGKMTGRFRSKHHRLKIFKPGGNCPQH